MTEIYCVTNWLTGSSCNTVANAQMAFGLAIFFCVVCWFALIYLMFIRDGGSFMKKEPSPAGGKA